MSRRVGYGEDALTLWALQHRIDDILREFKDNTAPDDCLVYYRPSFGRSGGEGSAEFGEFDAVIASRMNFYLIESKWDNGTKSGKETLTLRREQILRHNIFEWYLNHWGSKYSGNWQAFVDEEGKNFRFGKKMAPAGSLLARNLESILSSLLEHCTICTAQNNVEDVLLFFYNAKNSRPLTDTNSMFRLVNIEYGKAFPDRFVTLL
jgi:hypothetical protein